MKRFSISLVDIEKKLGKKLNRSPKNLQSICKDLTENNLSLYGSAEFMPLCSKCKLVKEDGVLVMEIQINSKLHKSLLNLSVEFTQINFQYFMQLNGLSEKKMYVLLSSMAGLTHYNMDLKTLYSILQVPKSYVKKFDNFKRRVLDKSMLSINRFENFNVSYHIDKSGRRIKMLNFKIERFKTKKQKPQYYQRKDMNMEEWDLACAGKLYNDNEEIVDTEIVDSVRRYKM